MNRLLFTLIASLSYFQTQAQETSASASDDKMNVVLGVLLIVLTGIFAYLILLDRKLNRIKKNS